MSEMNIFEKYLKSYLDRLMENHEQYFIAVTDIEKTVADQVNPEHFPECRLVWTDKRDYSQAVSLRNNRDLGRIVLLSRDSIKMIDSLKDFLEYPIVSTDNKRVIGCLEYAFEFSFDKQCIKIIEFILDNVQTPIQDILDFVNSSKADGKADSLKMLKNLYMFGIWTSEKNVIDKRYLRRLKRYSDLSVVERRLPLMESRNLELRVRTKRRLLKLLTESDFQEIFKTVTFEDVEPLFTVKSVSDSRIEPLSEVIQYENSYEFIMDEGIDIDVCEWETEVRDIPDKLESLSRAIDNYKISGIETMPDEFEKVQSIIRGLPLPEERERILVRKIRELQKVFCSAVTKGREYTPALLFSYSKAQEELVRQYFSLLGCCASDERIMKACAGSGLMECLQSIFCRREEGRVVMPFFHPVVGLYYLRLRQAYERHLEFCRSQNSRWAKDLLGALVEKEQMWFPVNYLLVDGVLYQLDYTSLRRRNGEIDFLPLKENAGGTWINIRLLNEDLIDYIKRNRFQSEIRVTIVDINDISELMFLLDKLRVLPDSQDYMIHRVVLNIVSRKENELKLQLGEQLDSDMGHPQVMFRFTRQLYLDGERYNLDAMLADSDLLFLADTSLLYQKPRQVVVSKDANWYLWRFDDIQMESLLCEDDLTETLWDSLQRVDLEEEFKVVRWNTREFRYPLLGQIRDAVSKNPLLTVVIMTSNRGMLRYIYHMRDFQVRKNSLAEKLLFINFHQGGDRRDLAREGSPSVKIAWKGLQEAVLGNWNMEDAPIEGEGELGPVMEFSREKDRLLICIEVCTHFEDDEKEELRSYYGELCRLMVQLASENTLFKDSLLNILYQQADSLKSAMFVDWMGRHLNQEPLFCFKEVTEGHIPAAFSDCGDILEFQDLLQFVRDLNSVDEHGVHWFAGIFKKKLLKACLKTADETGLIEEQTLTKMNKILQRMEEGESHEQE